jgi:hypothetical protein
MLNAGIKVQECDATMMSKDKKLGQNGFVFLVLIAVGGRPNGG